MTRVLPRTNFHSSTLLRCLADLNVAEAAEPQPAFAEKLSLWIHFTDAITLSAVHSDSLACAPHMPPEAHRIERDGAATEFERIQALLRHSVMLSCAPDSGKSHIKLPVPIRELPPESAAAYAPYHRFYQAHQHDMELRIQPLRSRVREALAKVSPRLRKLADLDATMEKILREREKQLLAKVPVLLKKRFEQLFKAHQQRLADTRQADSLAASVQAGAWLAHFCNDMQMLLLAEVELRLQPTLGLMEAFSIQDK
jgi:hypothetical protein